MPLESLLRFALLSLVDSHAWVFKARRLLIGSRHRLHQGSILQHVLKLLQLHLQNGQFLAIIHLDLHCLHGLELVVRISQLDQLGECVQVEL